MTFARWWRQRGRPTSPAALPAPVPIEEAEVRPPLSGPVRSMFDLADRAMAPLAPAFTAMAAEWPCAISPERVLRSVLLMAVLDLPSAEALSARLVDDPLYRRFLRLPDDHLVVDAQALAAGQARLIRNGNARDVVSAFLGQMRSSALMHREPFAENAQIVEAWTDLHPAGRPS